MSDELPQGWATVSLDGACSLITDGTHQTPRYVQDGVPFLSTANLRPFQAGFDFSDYRRFVSNQEHAELTKRCKPEKGDVLVSKCGTIGRVKEVDVDFAFSIFVGLALLKPHRSLFAPRFTEFWLNAPEVTREFEELSPGSTRRTLTLKGIKSVHIPLPPLAEQRRIVAKLETLLGKVDACQQRLAKIPVLLKRFRQSVLAAACSGRLTADWREENPIDNTEDTDGSTDLPQSWKSVEFGELIGDGPQNGLYKPASFYGDGTLIVRIDAFYDGTITAWDELKRVSLTKKEQSQFELRNHDILVNRVNSPKFLGKSALVRKLKEPCVYESNMMRLRLDVSRTLPEYAILYLQSIPGLVELRKNAKHAVNQSSINQEDVKSAMFNLPPLAEQQEIVRRVEALFALADQIEARFAKAQAQVDKLTPSLLARAFAGQLVPQNPNDEPAEQLLERIKHCGGKLE